MRKYLKHKNEVVFTHSSPCTIPSATHLLLCPYPVCSLQVIYNQDLRLKLFKVYPINFWLTSNYILSSKRKPSIKQHHKKRWEQLIPLLDKGGKRDLTNALSLPHHLLIFNLILLFITQSTYSKIEEPLYPYVVLQKGKKILLFVFLVQTL